jgi:hypothetical protein
MSLKRRKSILEFNFFDSVENQLLSDFTALLIDSETSDRKLFHRTEHGVRGVFGWYSQGPRPLLMCDSLHTRNFGTARDNADLRLVDSGVRARTVPLASHTRVTVHERTPRSPNVA